jgi:translation initiation factor 4G
VRGILNKLTPEKFQKLSDDLLQTELNSGVILKGVILLVSRHICSQMLEINVMSVCISVLSRMRKELFVISIDRTSLGIQSD